MARMAGLTRVALSHGVRSDEYENTQRCNVPDAQEEGNLEATATKTEELKHIPNSMPQVN